MQKNNSVGWVIAEAVNEVHKTNIIGTNGRRVVGEGILQRAEAKNRNGRYYAKNELFPQIKTARTVEMLKTGFPSENGHPMSTELSRQSVIDPNNVVAYFKKLWIDGDYIKATFSGSNLPMGEAFDLDLRDGYQPAWSLRAIGRIEKTAKGSEVKDLTAITWDRVYYPSHVEAYTSGIVQESSFIKSKELKLRTPNPVANTTMTESGIIVPIYESAAIEYIKAQSKNYKHITESLEIMCDKIKIDESTNTIVLSDSTSGVMYGISIEDYITNEIRNAR